MSSYSSFSGSIGVSDDIAWKLFGFRKSLPISTTITTEINASETNKSNAVNNEKSSESQKTSSTETSTNNNNNDTILNNMHSNIKIMNDKILKLQESRDSALAKYEEMKDINQSILSQLEDAHVEHFEEELMSLQISISEKFKQFFGPENINNYEKDVKKK